MVLDSDDKIAIAYTDFALFGDRAKLVYEKFNKPYQGDIKENFYMINFPEFDAKKLELENYIHGSSVYKRKIFNLIGGYLESENTAEDYNLFYRMIKSGYVAKKTQNTLLEYRQHSREQVNEKLSSYSKQLYYKRRIQELENIIRQSQSTYLYKFIVIYIKIKDILKYKGFWGLMKTILKKLLSVKSNR